MKKSKNYIQPIGDRILVKQCKVDDEQVKGGIIIPDTAKEKPQEAEVIALGTGKLDESGKKINFQVNIGDIVLTSKYGVTEVTINDEKYIIVREEDILGIIK